MENSIGRLKIFISQPHVTESIIVKDSNAATPIHEYLSEFVSTNLRRHHQSQVTRIINLGRVILTTPHNGLLIPAQVTGNCRLNDVHNPFMELLLSLAQTGSKHMVLPAIELLWIGLVSPLLLLLMTLAGLLIKAPLNLLRIGI